ncbi:MAG: lactate dehydrogenase [Eubacterium sp.]|jgi:malate/lactate dehydrogenase|uniref:lactate dehydrogenase n=1 Tax=Eubacterium sp. F2 TaxID=3381348 RepID=UPI003907ED1F|nr:lactate dehydrogenase [Eubacterium sp.]MCI2197382.1 lactate dehydrogenase [Eubacterium sp.]
MTKINEQEHRSAGGRGGELPLCVRRLAEEIGVRAEGSAGPSWAEKGLYPPERRKARILALGDVGTNLLLGLRLLGGDVFSEIGICDLNEKQTERLEIEVNQIRWPFSEDEGDPEAGLPAWTAPEMPEIRVVSEEELFNGDVFIFCASRGVPDISQKGDVRMAQMEANRGLIRHFAGLADQADYQGLVCVVSDPVDPLCGAFLEASHLRPGQIQGYGLGVMNARGMYFAERNPAWARYLTEGRAYGPHGEDLVLADSLEDYDDEVSRALTEKAAHANLEVRDLGFKPFLAPAFSSAALSILLTVRGRWHYGSVYIGNREKGAYFGVKNRLRKGAEWQIDDPEVPEALYSRLKNAYMGLALLRENQQR